MHYKNGREAKEGDPVVFSDFTKKTNIGRVHSLVSGCETCNGQVAMMVPGGVIHTCVTLKDLYHAEDAHKAIADKEATKV